MKSASLKGRLDVQNDYVFPLAFCGLYRQQTSVKVVEINISCCFNIRCFAVTVSFTFIEVDEMEKWYLRVKFNIGTATW